MFPQTLENEGEKPLFNIISDSSEIRKTPNFDFENKKTLLKNGDVDLVDKYENVRNWIMLFFKTPLGQYPIYEGTGFGTSLYALKGCKTITGLQFAQIKSEIENGFKLNPNIERLIKFDMNKVDNVCNVYVKVQLIDGYILEEKIEAFRIT